jgi:hypothetical protein
LQSSAEKMLCRNGLEASEVRVTEEYGKVDVYVSKAKSVLCSGMSVRSTGHVVHIGIMKLETLR